MKVYVAGNPRESEFQIRFLMDRLSIRGHKITWDWMKAMAQEKNDVGVEEWFADRQQAGVLDFLGVLDAEILILVDSLTGAGKYIEMGVALGSLKCRKIIVIAPDRPTIFFCMPKVVCVEDTTKALEMVDDITFIEEYL